jgi:hypothetical protein
VNTYTINVAVQYGRQQTWMHEYRIVLPDGTSEEKALRMRDEYRAAFPSKMVDLYRKTETNRQVA